MSRSVLPSTRRRAAAAELAHIRRSHRREVRRQLRSFSERLSPDAAAALDLAVHDRYPTRAVREAVFSRRSADKVAPLMRWAVGSTLRIRHEDRLSHLAAILPASLIGQHAMTHLDFIEDLNPIKEWSVFWSRPRLLPDGSSELHDAVRDVIEGGHHAAFNTLVTSGASTGLGTLSPSYVCRPLLGLHDVESFVKELLPETDTWRSNCSPALSVCIEALSRLGYRHVAARTEEK